MEPQVETQLPQSTWKTTKTTLGGWKQRFSDWNVTRPHLPDVHDHHKFKVFASVLTHIGFFAKALLYGSMGI